MHSPGRESERESLPRQRGLSFDEPVTLSGGGRLSRESLVLARKFAPTVIAVDGGANRLREWGVSVAAVVGDMDSVSDLPFWRCRGTTVLAEEEQDTTDLAKCLRLVQAPLHLAVGFLGSRLDHTLAAISVAAVHRRGKFILIDDDDIAFAAPIAWEGDLPAGSRISILALRPVRVLDSTGLRWPPDGLILDLGATRGISNVAPGGRIRISFERAGAMLVVERKHLREAVRSLLRPPGPVER